MTIINTTHEFIFVHVPKAAGTSVTALLSQYTTVFDIEIGSTSFGEEIQPAYQKRFGLSKHSPAQKILSIVGSGRWHNYFVFSFVRNPYDRLYSTFKFLRRWHSPDAAFNTRMAGFRDFDDFVSSDIWRNSAGPDNIFKPQSHWIKNRSPKEELDFVGKVESIAQDMDAILEHLGLTSANAADLEHLNARPVIPGDPIALGEANRQKIMDTYAEDFRLFDYDLKPPAFLKIAG